MRKVAAGRLVRSGRRVATVASVVRMEWLAAPRNFAHVSALTDWGRRERRERSGFFQRAGRKNQCQCNNGVVLCVAESDAVEAPEVPRVKQCQDNAGGERAVGDVWDVECNTCRCTDTGVAACTLKLCNFNFGGQQCRDRDGVSRSVGEEWREGCNFNFGGQ